MRIISAKIFREFAIRHPDCGKQLNLLEKDLEKGNFENPNQIKNYFPNVSLLNDNRVVLNIHGNDYRMVLKINYKAKIAFVRFLGTHAEYDRIDANKI
jgi:mRNA interferase HigB